MTTPSPGNNDPQVPSSARGGLDLSQLGSGTAAEARPAGPVVPSLVVDVTDADFTDMVELSSTVPVVLDLWAEWCGPCRQLSPVLEQLTEEYGGRFVLAKIDVDANPQVSSAFQVQSIPSVIALVAGRPAPLFQGALPKEQVRQYLDQLLALAAQHQVSGTVVVDPGAAPREKPLPPLHQEALEAIEGGDYAGAEAAYRKALGQNPADHDAKAGLAQVGLLTRTDKADPNAVRQRAAESPSDVEAQLAAADLDVLGGHVEDAFSRLVNVVRNTAGDDRDRARLRLLDLFEVVGTDDPRVASARIALARAIF